MTPLAFVNHRVGRTRLQHRRSRNGCLTCKRRKVRCNEQKPQCYHCHRLSLECVWKETSESPPRRANSIEEHSVDNNSGERGNITCSGSSAVFRPNAALENGWLPAPLADDVVDLATDHIQDFSLFPDFFLGEFSDDVVPRDMTLQEQAALSTDVDRATRLHLATPKPTRREASKSFENPGTFHTPRILDPIDNGPICASLRAQLDDMASTSTMVRSAMTAFAAIQSSSSGENAEDYQKHYDEAANELSESFRACGDGLIMTTGGSFGCVLTAIFFLTYINFLTRRMDLANENLARAHAALQMSSRASLTSLEQRIVVWTRWIDARAAVAGGQGEIVNDTSCVLPSTPSTNPGATPGSQFTTSPSAASSNSSAYDIMYEMVCQPGIAFFQEAQTITGRITRIAHLHRSRGSVEDETEVMAIAADILRDLSSLYNRRPALMDDAVAGNIDRILMEPLASAVVRSFRTYVANFYVCYIHLHRVAHRHLVRSEVVSNAMRKIKEITHLMLRNNESLPVNMLWPLFMWGSEEDDEYECRWIVDTLRSCGRVATNANMAADVLQEIQKRQAKGGSRVDIRSVCVELFDTPFAII